MRNISEIEREQNASYPGLTVHQDADAIVVHVPMKFHRRRGRNYIVTPDGQTTAGRRQTNEPLVEAIAKAYRWQEQLESGKFADMTELAKAAGVDRRYVARILGLTSLAPDIVQGILAGNEPSGMSLTKLCKGIPDRWGDQQVSASKQREF